MELNASLRQLGFAVALAAAAALAGAQPAKAPSPRLDDVHKAKGLACAACHKENPPAKLVGTAQCRSCHGDFKALAKKTEHTEPNPHQSHQGEQDCAECHHVHKPSEDNCAKCHVTNWRVP